MDKVVIVVPVYKAELSLSEQVSLKQLYKVLGNYPICFVIPEKLKNIYEDVWSESFPDKMFSSILEYSKTLLSPFFYNRFREYEYMLLYQLDAYVFSDKLLYYCNLGYDYIGAPIPYSQWRGLKARVGNGGLSLRKISSCIEMTTRKVYIYKLTGKQEEFEVNEDKFFAFCGVSEEIDFLVPKVKEALGFSVEYNVQNCHKKITGKNLPFGCHGWSKPHNLKFWNKYISGYNEEMEILLGNLKKIDFLSYEEIHKESINNYLWDRVLMYVNSSRLRMLMENCAGQKKIVLWGIGKVGRRELDSFKTLDINIDYIVDENPNIDQYRGVKILRVDETRLNDGKHYVIITTTKYEKYVELQLKKIGLNARKDFNSLRNIKDYIIREIYFSSY